MYRLSRTSRNVKTFLIFALSLKSLSALATVILGNQNCQINIVVLLQIQIKIGDCICIMHMFPALRPIIQVCQIRNLYRTFRLSTHNWQTLDLYFVQYSSNVETFLIFALKSKWVYQPFNLQALFQKTWFEKNGSANLYFFWFEKSG